MLSRLSKYNKFWVALTAPLGVLVYVLAPGEAEASFIVTRDEWYLVLVALASAIGVYATPNKTK